MVDIEKLKKLIDPKDSRKAAKYLEEHMTSGEYISWLIDYFKKQIGNKNKLIYMPIDIVGIGFLHYINDKFEEPYLEIEDDTEEAVIIEASEKSTLKDVDTSLANNYFNKNIPEYRLMTLREQYLNTDDKENWYRQFLIELLNLYAPDHKVQLLYCLFAIKGNKPLDNLLVFNPVVYSWEWKFVDET